MDDYTKNEYMRLYGKYPLSASDFKKNNDAAGYFVQERRIFHIRNKK